MLPQIAEEALSAAGLSPKQRRRTALFVGSTAYGIARAEGEYLSLLERAPGSSFALSRIGFQEIRELMRETCGIEGPDFAFNTACTASANALLAAQRSLSVGRFDHALILGVELANRTTLTGFSGLQLLADELRPFDARRSGIVLGEGIGAAVLERGSGRLNFPGGSSNSDTYSVTSANPDGSSIARLEAEVLARASLKPDAIRGIKAHGTASPLNDAGEAAGLRKTFGLLPPLTALKPYLGHTLGACGIVEFALLGGALAEGFLPAVPGFSQEDPLLGVRPLTAAAPAPDGTYLLNYFGFGGNNTALLLEKSA
jgi:3-oxoacyl-[acyl-carrier-protein] synthase-1